MNFDVNNKKKHFMNWQPNVELSKSISLDKIADWHKTFFLQSSNTIHGMHGEKSKKKLFDYKFLQTIRHQFPCVCRSFCQYMSFKRVLGENNQLFLRLQLFILFPTCLKNMKWKKFFFLFRLSNSSEEHQITKMLSIVSSSIQQRETYYLCVPKKLGYESENELNSM